MNILQKKTLFITLLFVLILLPMGLAAREGEKTVAILPFHLTAPPDKEYLAEGLRDILGSRLRSETGARIVAKDVVHSALQAVGGAPETGNMDAFVRKLGVDYVIYGTITALGGGISIDARVYEADPGQLQPVREFYATAVSNDQVMRAIDTLSWDIIEQYFGKQRPAAMVPVQKQAAEPEKQERKTFTTAHPDKTFMSSGGGFALRGGRDFTKTRNLDMELRGFDVGDVDGDGEVELVLADKNEVKVFRRDGSRLNLFGMIKMLVRYPVHAVNVADLNGNGRAEIYISASDPTTPGSRAVEWDGSAFVDLFRDARWYVRPLEVPGRGMVLAGQSSGLQIAVEPGIYILSNKDGVLYKQEKLPVPAGVNLFNFNYADLEGSGKHAIVALDDSFNLRVIRGGETVWKSEERFAGTKRFLGGEPLMSGGRNPLINDEVDAVGERFQRYYLPSRILVADVDKDGADDIIINRNPESIATMAPNLIQYSSGTLVGLKWNGLGLEELWKTRKIDGYIINYQVKSLAMENADIPEDELFIGMMLNTGTLNPFGGEQSTVVIYPFNFEKPAAN